jgi:hypothetical protein
MVTAAEARRHYEIRVGNAAREYLGFWWSYNGHWADDPEAMQQQQELRIQLCSDLHFLLERHLSEPDWPPDAWVDALFPDRINVLSREALEIPGAFLWVQGQEHWWLEAGFASVVLDEGVYTLKVGDASKGLRNVPYTNPRRAKPWIEPTNWMFTFQGKLGGPFQ